MLVVGVQNTILDFSGSAVKGMLKSESYSDGLIYQSFGAGRTWPPFAVLKLSWESGLFEYTILYWQNFGFSLLDQDPEDPHHQMTV